MKRAISHEPMSLKERIQRLGFHGLIARWNDLENESWLERLASIEEETRKQRSLERRVKNARIGSFKPMADFDWGWLKHVDREAIEELFTLDFVDQGLNIVLIGANGLGKTMILRNLAHVAVVRGLTVRHTTASDMLSDLSGTNSSASLKRRLRGYCHPNLLCVDEVGYLSYDARYADLFFEVITRRYEEKKPIALSTNKVFNDWKLVFPHAACVVTLVDRLVHRSEILHLEGDSYRAREAKEGAAQRAKTRAARRR